MAAVASGRPGDGRFRTGILGDTDPARCRARRARERRRPHAAAHRARPPPRGGSLADDRAPGRGPGRLPGRCPHHPRHDADRRQPDGYRPPRRSLRRRRRGQDRNGPEARHGPPPVFAQSLHRLVHRRRPGGRPRARDRGRARRAEGLRAHGRASRRPPVRAGRCGAARAPRHRDRAGADRAPTAADAADARRERRVASPARAGAGRRRAAARRDRDDRPSAGRDDRRGDRKDSTELPPRAAIAAPARPPPPRRRDLPSRSSRVDATAEPAFVPDFLGRAMADAQRIAESESLQISTIGAIEGRVVSQIPVAGTVLEGPNRTVQLRFALRREEG